MFMVHTLSGAGPTKSSSYSKASTLAARPSSRVGGITIALGALSCKKGSHADHSPTSLYVCVYNI